MQPKVYPRTRHPVSRKNIDPDALKVLYRLYRAGHTAYLVGGGVRDLILGREPKDFDIATSARPSQIKKLFRNCRLIGRRFRLAHVHFGGDKILEVSTFRREPDLEDGLPEADEEGVVDLQIRMDNTFGSPEEDARRRDFTVNGLFYDIGDYSILDYVGGVEDLHRRIIRTIGDPNLRFQEDPVRMIRAIKFCARLGFKMDRATWEGMVAHRWAIERAAAPRVQEEIARLLESSTACRCMELLDDSGLLEVMVPEVFAYLERADRGQVPEDPDGQLYYRLLGKMDDLPGSLKVRPLLFAIMLAPLCLEAGLLGTEPPDQLVRNVMKELGPRLGISRKDQERVAQILLTQRRMLPRKRKRTFPKTLVERSYFSEAFALYRMLVEATGIGEAELAWWNERLGELRGTGQVSSRPSPGLASPDTGEQESSKPRRRRRRRPGRGGHQELVADS